MECASSPESIAVGLDSQESSRERPTAEGGELSMGLPGAMGGGGRVAAGAVVAAGTGWLGEWEEPSSIAQADHKGPI